MGRSRGKSGNSSPCRGAAVNAKEINKSGSHLCCRLLMCSDPCYRLLHLVSNSSPEKINVRWGGVGYFCHFSCHWLDFMLQTQTLHPVSWAQSCRCLPTSDPGKRNDLLHFSSLLVYTGLGFYFCWKGAQLKGIICLPNYFVSACPIQRLLCQSLCVCFFFFPVCFYFF